MSRHEYFNDEPFTLGRSLRHTAREVLGDAKDVDLPDIYETAYEHVKAANVAGRLRGSMLHSPEERAEDEFFDGEERLPNVTLYLPNGVAAYSIALDSDLIAVTKRYIENQEPVPAAELVARAIGRSCMTGMIVAGYTPDAVNAFNAAYYSTETVAFAPESRLANLYVMNRPLNFAIGRMIAQNASRPLMAPTRIKELSCGSYLQQWRHRIAGLASEGLQNMHVTFTDFVKLPVDAAPKISGVTCDTEAYSLFDDMPYLDESERYDAMMVTYGFDSVWLPEDMHVVRHEDKWYRTLYNVKVAEWHHRYYDISLAILKGEALPDAHPSDFNNIFVERVLQEIDPVQHPYGFFLLGHDKDAFNFPGGLIKRVVNAFESQLKRGGVFVSCDSGDFGQPNPPSCRDVGITGVGARYHMDDYVLAKEILEAAYGLEVTLLTLPELAEGYLPPEWAAEATEDEFYSLAKNPTNGVMIVKNPRDNFWFDESSGRFKNI